MPETRPGARVLRLALAALSLLLLAAAAVPAWHTAGTAHAASAPVSICASCWG